MFYKFPALGSRLHLLASCAMAALALAACNADNSGGVGGATATTSAASQPFVVTAIPRTSVQVGTMYKYTPTVSTSEGMKLPSYAGARVLSYAIVNKPEWATFVEASGELSGTPAQSDVGTSGEIQIDVSDGTAHATVGPFRINVIPPPTGSGLPPTILPTIAGVPAATVIAGQSYSFAPTVTDPSRLALSFAIVNCPAWARFNTATGALSGTPTSASTGTFANILISVSAGGANVSLPAFAIQVVPAADNGPTISGTPAATVIAGAAYSFTPVASDPEGNALTFRIANAPPWASFSSNTGQLSGTPPSADVGTYPNIVITVSDGTLNASLPAFSIEVQASTNDTPTIGGTPAPSVIAGSAYSFTPRTTDPSGQLLVFSIQAMPRWASFSRSTGELSGTPASSDVGTYAGILISVSDGNESASLPAFAIQVKALPDHAPLISGTPPASVIAGSSYLFRPTASDPEGNPLTFSVANLPPWASFSSASGALSGTPTRANIGIFANIVITVSDGTLSASLPAFSIDVAAAVGPPVIGGTPSTRVTAGSAYAFTPSASDPNGNPLTFSVANRPSWARFDSSTGELSGTPAAGNVGTFSNILISVSNGTLSSSLPAFAISVTPPADPPPTIGGVPVTSVTAGSAYSFTPSAADADGDTLTFSINNLPAWAAFNTRSGTLSGTPGPADVGSYASIVISVSDGTSSASLAPFSITVTQAASGSATLDWTAPTQNTDGTPLTNLAGFNIYYGRSAGNLGSTVQVPNPGLTTYVFSSLAAGTWYFSVNAYSTSGAESVVSNIASTTIP